MISLADMSSRLVNERPELAGGFRVEQICQLLRIDANELMELVDVQMAGFIEGLMKEGNVPLLSMGRLVNYQMFLMGMTFGTELANQPDVEEHG